MPEKFNLKTFLSALSVMAVVLVFGFIFVFVVFKPSTVVHDHRAEEALIQKHWPVRKQ